MIFSFFVNAISPVAWFKWSHVAFGLCSCYIHIRTVMPDEPHGHTHGTIFCSSWRMAYLLAAFVSILIVYSIDLNLAPIPMFSVSLGVRTTTPCRRHTWPRFDLISRSILISPPFPTSASWAIGWLPLLDLPKRWCMTAHFRKRSEELRQPTNCHGASLKKLVLRLGTHRALYIGQNMVRHVRRIEQLLIRSTISADIRTLRNILSSILPVETFYAGEKDLPASRPYQFREVEKTSKQLIYSWCSWVVRLWRP